MHRIRKKPQNSINRYSLLNEFSEFLFFFFPMTMDIIFYILIVKVSNQRDIFYRRNYPLRLVERGHFCE